MPVGIKDITPDWLKPENESVFDPLSTVLMRKAARFAGLTDPSSIMGVAGTSVEGPAMKRAGSRAIDKLLQLLHEFTGPQADAVNPAATAAVKALGPTERVTGRFVDLAPIKPPPLEAGGPEFLLPRVLKRDPQIAQLHQEHLARLEAMKKGPAPMKGTTVNRTEAIDRSVNRSLKGKVPGLSKGEIEEIREIATGTMKDKPLKEVVDWLMKNKNYGKKSTDLLDIIRNNTFPTRDLTKVRMDEALPFAGGRPPKMATEILKREIKSEPSPRPPNRTGPMYDSRGGTTHKEMREAMKARFGMSTMVKPTPKR